MKVYVLACFKMEPKEYLIKELIDWLNSGLRVFAKDGHFLNVTSSEACFLNDARRLVKGDPGPVFNSSFSNRRSKRSRRPKYIKTQNSK